MKIGVISDLHVPHWLGRWPYIAEDIRASIATERPDLIVDAGDMQLSPADREHLAGEWGVPIRTVRGNHDYYGRDWEKPDVDVHHDACNGVNFLFTTLWTDFNRNAPEAHHVVARCLMDYQAIRGFSTKKAYEAHLYHKAFIETMSSRGRVDVIVTHHRPSMRSIHGQYIKGKSAFELLLNYGFASNLDDLVERSRAKLWVHGHTHCRFDYMIGNTRVLCNPLGYPGENRLPYNPVYVTL
jgi:predicted phosphodiesterase